MPILQVAHLLRCPLRWSVQEVEKGRKGGPAPLSPDAVLFETSMFPVLLAITAAAAKGATTAGLPRLRVPGDPATAHGAAGHRVAAKCVSDVLGPCQPTVPREGGAS